jgi:uncharacterized protein YjiS (DUF1127 family)
MKRCILRGSCQFVAEQGGTNQSHNATPEMGPRIMFNTLINTARDRLAKRQRYNRLVSEIQSLSSRDLADINGNRSEMLHHAYREVYGR